jgi:hypothetical protein
MNRSHGEADEYEAMTGRKNADRLLSFSDGELKDYKTRVLVWGLIAAICLFLLVLVVHAYNNRPKKCTLVHEGKEHSWEKNKHRPEHFIYANIQPMARRLRDAQRAIEKDLTHSCGPHVPKNSQCYQKRLQEWRKFLEDHAMTGELPAEVPEIPLQTAKEHEILLSEDTVPFAEIWENDRFYDTYLPFRKGGKEEQMNRVDK